MPRVLPPVRVARDTPRYSMRRVSRSTVNCQAALTAVPGTPRTPRGRQVAPPAVPLPDAGLEGVRSGRAAPPGGSSPITARRLAPTPPPPSASHAGMFATHHRGQPPRARSSTVPVVSPEDALRSLVRAWTSARLYRIICHMRGTCIETEVSIPRRKLSATVCPPRHREKGRQGERDTTQDFTWTSSYGPE